MVVDREAISNRFLRCVPTSRDFGRNDNKRFFALLRMTVGDKPNIMNFGLYAEEGAKVDEEGDKGRENPPVEID
jgi:hypothetical protein